MYSKHSAKRSKSHAQRDMKLRRNNLKALAVALFLLMVTVTPNLAAAQSILPSSDKLFGGKSLFAMPMIPNPYDPSNPFCPAHLLVQDKTDMAAPVIGLYFNNNGYFRYLHSMLLIGSNKFFISPYPVGPLVLNILGKRKALPYPTCFLFFPYPVYPVALNELGAYYIGTSLLP